MSYAAWKSSVLGTFITTVAGIKNPYDVECTNVDWSWANYLWPNVPIIQTITTGDARTLFDAASSQYFTKLKNNGGSTPDITPQQGDIAVYGATPADGFTNQYKNDDGHTGVVDSWDANGLTLVQQDGSQQSLPVQTKYRPYSYAPLIGLLRPNISNQGGDMTMTEADARAVLYLNGWTDKDIANANPIPGMVGRTLEDFVAGVQAAPDDNPFKWNVGKAQHYDADVAAAKASAGLTKDTVVSYVQEHLQ